MTDIFMAGSALIVDGAQEIIAMGNKSFIGCHGGFLQVGVTAQTARIVSVIFPVGTLGFPIDIFGITEIFHPQIMDARLGFRVQIVKGAVVGQMAIGTG